MKQFPKTSPAEVIELAKNRSYTNRLKAINSPNVGEDVLEILVKDPDLKVREAVAKLGYGLDRLMYDSVSDVRAAVAQHGYGLDTLVHDKSWYIRKLVAEQSYGLDLLIDDEDAYVRAAVARQGYGLDTLLYDDSAIVRCVVAERGYGLDTLMYDKSPRVRAEVKKHLSSHIQTQGDYTLEIFQRDTPTYEKVCKKYIFVDKWFINNFPYGAPSAEEVLAKLEEESQAPYNLSSLQQDITTLTKVMEKHFFYEQWFNTKFPNGASSAEEVLTKLKED